MPSAVGYQPTLATEMGAMGELHLLKVLLRVFQAVYVPTDDLTDPAPATTFAHLDATTVLSDAFRVSSSWSRFHLTNFNPQILGDTL